MKHATFFQNHFAYNHCPSQAWRIMPFSFWRYKAYSEHWLAYSQQFYINSHMRVTKVRYNMNPVDFSKCDKWIPTI